MEIKIFLKSQTSELQDIFIKSNINNIQLHPSKEANEKLSALWMLNGGSLERPIPKLTSNHRPVMLIPANSNNMQHVVGTYPRLILNTPQPSPVLASPYAALSTCSGLGMPYIRTNSMPLIYAPPPPPSALQSISIPGSMPGTFRLGKYYRTANGIRRKRKPGQLLHTSKTETKRIRETKRRKSDADVIDGKLSFRYTGLDRVIADNFLARQEQTQNMTTSNSSYNQNLYTSSSSSNDSETYGGGSGFGSGPDGRLTLSKTKILCQDVVM